MELAPLRVDEASGEVTLARRLVVRLAFAGRVEGERGGAASAASAPGRSAATPPAQLLARLATRSRGVHTVAFEQIPGLSSPVAASDLRLSRLGAPVAFHLEPGSGPFGPGSVLFFFAEGTDSAYANEAVYELAIGPGGLRMRGALPSRRRSPPPPRSPSCATSAPSRTTRSISPHSSRPETSGSGTTGSAAGRVSPIPSPSTPPSSPPRPLGSPSISRAAATPRPTPTTTSSSSSTAPSSGRPVSTAWSPTLTLELPSSLLLEGDNTLRLENPGDTGSTASFVYLDRFSIEVPEGSLPSPGSSKVGPHSPDA